MKAITEKWRRWVSIPLAAVLVLGTIIGVRMTLEPGPASASDVATSNVILTGQVAAGNYTFVQFDIAWDYSWRDSVNWDAAWVFVKYQLSGGSDWQHATLDTSGHTAPTGSTINATADGRGAFIYRDSNGAGSVDWNDVGLKWKYGDDGLSDSAIVKVKVFAIEMVYIPGGVSFDIGDGNGTSESNYAFHTGVSNSTVTISTILASDIRVDANSNDDAQIENIGIGIDGDGGLDTDDDGSVDNADFPTGYNAFYSMKYEISQGQYLEFLNTLTRTQQQTRTFTDVSTDTITNVYVTSNTTTVINRQGIRAPGTENGTTDPITFGSDLDGDGTFNESNDGEWIACNYLSWADGAAYGDWAGMRPMTELEFEKISRGPTTALYQEYAWGNASIAGAAYTLSSAQQAGEVIADNYADDPAGNASYVTTDGVKDGPLRVGIFATTNSTRAEAGASYYGVMELSGNLRERAVTVGNPTGRGFAGSHGDGSLSTDGDANTSGWPGTGAAGTGNRGGHWDASAEGLSVSNRGAAANTYAGRHDTYGFRLVRTQ